MKPKYREHIYQLKEDNISAFLNLIKFDISSCGNRIFDTETKLNKFNITQNRFIFVKHGEVEISVDNVVYNLSQGDLFFSKAFSVVEAATLTKDSYIYYLYFDISPIHLNNLFTKKILFSNSLFKMQEREETLNILLKNLVDTANNQIPSHYYVAQSYFRLLIGEVYNHISKGNAVKDGKIIFSNEKEKYLSLATDYITKNIDSNIALEHLANAIGITPNYIYKIFKEYLDISPKEYILSQKLDYAQKLLKSSNLSIKEISLKLHFSSDAHFITSFKKRYSVTPKKYKTDLLK